ncbi:MAG TPA: hypothetical protein VFG20_02550 [Planctomycetaceae bacterium]|nr:hypothetical protein [Planctomycetaceae bacterium]
MLEIARRALALSLIACWSLTLPVTAAETPPTLVSLAEARFPSLSAEERKLLEAVSAGNPFSLADDSMAAAIRAEVLQWMCAASDASALLPRQGITVTQAKFTGPLNLRFLKLTVPLSLLKCELEAVDVDSAEFVALSLDGSRITSLRGDQLRVQRDLSLSEGFTCQESLRLPFSWIEGHLDLSGARLLGTSDALLADGCRVDGDLRLRADCQTHGRVSLAGARIAGNFDCDRAQLNHDGSTALSLPSARINGDWTLREAKLKGGVICHGARVQGDLDADHCEITFPEGTAFRGYALSVGGDLRFVSANLAGDVLLEAADVGRDLNFADAQFDSSDPPVVVTLQGMTAVRRFRWTGVTFRPEAPVDLDLRSATVGILYDDERSWPPEGHLRLHGFDYSEIHDDAPFDAPSRIRWLRRQHRERFRTQPYEQVADIFRKGGLAVAARHVLIAKEADRADHMELTTGDWYWYRVFGPLIAYGYEPWRSFVWMILVVSIGATLFQIGYWKGWMTPTKVVEFVSANEGAQPYLSADYPKFNAIIYSLDVFAPFTYLHQANYWVPNPTRGERIRLGFWSPRPGELLRVYLWLHVVAGWLLTSLLVAGLTGLVQH